MPVESFLSSFARPLDYCQEKDDLNPIAILIVLSKLYEDYEQNRILRCYVLAEDTHKEIDLTRALKNFERLLEIRSYDKDGARYLKVINKSINDLHLSLNAKSITLQSEKLNKVFIELVGNSTYKILNYINRSHSYIITFDTPELIYSNRKLFQDNRLLGNIDSFLKIFVPYEELNGVTSEKGKVNKNSHHFDADSVFHFVEKNFIADSVFFICDDLGREWADHIGLNENSIRFYHSKFNTSKFSATSFQDIVGQAQKNFGNLSPADNQWEFKQKFWDKNYLESNISRIRKGDSAQDAIMFFKGLKSSPNMKKEVYLVINFISKTDLKDRLEKLRNGEVFTERNEVIQILWFISSLISSANEVGADVFICCKP